MFVLNAKELGMSGKSASHGKAFENAFMQVMMNKIIAAGGHAELVENNATHTAKSSTMSMIPLFKKIIKTGHNSV